MTSEVRNVCLIGGTGFIGRHIAAQLAAAGVNLTLLTRRRERSKTDLIVLPTAEVVEADVHDPAALRQLLAGQDAVVNLVGILQGTSAAFERAHVELPRKVAAACQAAGVSRLLHMSALGASEQGPSLYLRSKGAGERVVREAGLDVTVFRPSVVFGLGDSFLTMFAQLQRRFPLLPLASPDARFQPIWVEDVARCFVESLALPATVGAAYDLGGPRQYSLRELVAYVGEITGWRRTIVGLSPALSMWQAMALEYLPGGLMSRDNIRSMSIPSTVPGPFPAVFGWQPTRLEAIAPGYLAGQTPRGRFDAMRARAGAPR